MESLKRLKNFPGPEGPVVLVIMDGIGIGKYEEGDMVRKATTPTLDWLSRNGLSSQLKAHGTYVGLPSDDDMGNSEVGHNAIGSGRVFEQGARLVNESIETGSPLRRKSLEGIDREREKPWFQAPLYRPSVRWQCAQPYQPSRSPPGPGEKGRREKGVHSHPSRRTGRPFNLCPRLCGQARIFSFGIEKGGRHRLCHRLGRRAHEDNDGPLPGRLVDGRARLEDPCQRGRPEIQIGPGGHREGARGKSRHPRSGSPAVCHCPGQ